MAKKQLENSVIQLNEWVCQRTLLSKEYAFKSTYSNFLFWISATSILLSKRFIKYRLTKCNRGSSCQELGCTGSGAGRRMLGPALVLTKRRSRWGLRQLRTPCVVVPAYMITVPATPCMCLTCGRSQLVCLGRGSGSRALWLPGTNISPPSPVAVSTSWSSQPMLTCSVRGCLSRK